MCGNRISLWERMAMTPQQFYDLLNIELITLIFGLGIFSFVAGHAAGTAISVIRKFTHMAT